MKETPLERVRRRQFERIEKETRRFRVVPFFIMAFAGLMLLFVGIVFIHGARRSAQNVEAFSKLKMMTPEEAATSDGLIAFRGLAKAKEPLKHRGEKKGYLALTFRVTTWSSGSDSETTTSSGCCR